MLRLINVSHWKWQKAGQVEQGDCHLPTGANWNLQKFRIAKAIKGSGKVFHISARESTKVSAWLHFSSCSSLCVCVCVREWVCVCVCVLAARPVACCCVATCQQQNKPATAPNPKPGNKLHPAGHHGRTKKAWAGAKGWHAFDKRRHWRH